METRYQGEELQRVSKGTREIQRTGSPGFGKELRFVSPKALTEIWLLEVWRKEYYARKSTTEMAGIYTYIYIYILKIIYRKSLLSMARGYRCICPVLHRPQ